MKKIYIKVLLTSALSFAAVLPGLANTTQLSMSGAVNDILVVQIERKSDSKVVSGDDFQKSFNDPDASEILTFGTIDSRGIAAGNAIGALSTNSITPDSALQRVILDTAAPQSVYNVSAPPSLIAGAVYFIKGGYQIRTVRSPDMTGGIVTDVDVDTSGDIKSFVELSGLNTLASGSTVSANAIRGLVSPLAAFKAGVANNVPFDIDVGLYVETTTPTGAHTTTITFTGS